MEALTDLAAKLGPHLLELEFQVSGELRGEELEQVLRHGEATFCWSYGFI